MICLNNKSDGSTCLLTSMPMLFDEDKGKMEKTLKEPSVIFLSLPSLKPDQPATSISQMKHMFFEAMTKGQFLSEASIKFLNLKDMIEQFTDEVNGLPVGNNKSVRMKGIFALLNLLALCWKLESAQIKDKDVDFLQLKVYLVHAYNCEYVDFFLDVVLKLADRFSSVNFFETAKVLRLLYQERLSNMEQNKTPSSRITQMTVFLRKSKVKWFGLELKNMEILWSVHEKSKVGEAFKYKDAHWKMQSILTDLKIDEDCHFEILDKADSAKKHFQNIQKLCKDIASFEEKCLCLDANNASFDNKLKVYQDWVVLKAKLMEGTSHELLSLFEENEHLKCTLIMKTIQMMEAFKPIAKKEESEAMFYLKFKDRLMKAYFSLMECQTMMLLKSSFEDMPKIRSALDKIVKHFKRHSTELEQLFEARLYTRNCLHLRQGFFKLMIIFHTKYDFNRPKVSEFEFKLQHRIPMLLVVNSGLVANKQFVGKYNEENKFLCCFMPNTKEELCSEDMLQNLRQMAL